MEIFELSPPKKLADKLQNSLAKFEHFPANLFSRTKIENSATELYVKCTFGFALKIWTKNIEKCPRLLYI